MSQENAAQESTLEQVKAILSEQLNVSKDTITPETNIINDLNADSLEVLDVIMAVNDVFGVEIPDEDVEKVKTVDDIVSYIESHQ